MSRVGRVAAVAREVLLVGVVVGVTVPWPLHHRRLELVQDSAAYLAGADAVMAGGPPLDVDGRALTIWPPGFSVALAALKSLPGDDLVAIVLAYAVGAWAWSRGSGALAADAPSGWIRGLVPWVTLLSMSAWGVFGIVMSEALFLPLLAGALVAVARDLERPSPARLVVATLALSALPVVRYIGVVGLLVAALAAVLHLGRTRAALVRVGAWAGAAAVPWLLVGWHNVAVIGAFSGRGGEVPRGELLVRPLLAALGAMLWDGFVGWGVVPGLVLLWAGLTVALVRPTPRRTVAALWVGAYLGAFLAMSARMSLDAPNDRYLAPVHGPLLALLASGLSLGTAGRPAWLRGLRAAAVTLLALVAVARPARFYAGRMHGMPPDLGDPSWSADPAVAWIRALPPGVPVVADDVGAAYLHGGHRALRPGSSDCRLRAPHHDAGGRVAVVDFARTSAPMCPPDELAAGHDVLDDRVLDGSRVMLLRAR